MPKNNQEFWMNKLQGNKDREKFVTRELRKMGWRVIRVWEHELKSPLRVAGKIKKILNAKEGLDKRG
jgi:DNA mismatch endonuclease (patch repair protein)